MSKFLTVKEVATILKRSTDTIYRWIAEGKVLQDVRRVNDGYLIPEAEVLRILEDGKMK